MKDTLLKAFWQREDLRPKGLFELSEYMRRFSAIHFSIHPSEEGNLVAVSTDFRFGSIVTSGTDAKDLDRNIKDAILTSFEIPASYANEAAIQARGESLSDTGASQKEYALA